MSAEYQAEATENSKADEEAANAAALARSEEGLLDGDKVTSSSTTEAPSWCPEKFARYNDDGTFNAELSAQALSEAHSGLEKKFTQDRQQQSKTDEGDETEETTEEATDEAADEEVTEEESNEPLVTPEFWTSLTDEYNEHGDITPESRAILADLGIPDEMVNDYIEGQKARGAQYHDSVVSILGDNASEQYDALIDWADVNMDAAEAKIFNDAVTSGDKTRAQIAIRDLKQQYIRAEGSYDGIIRGHGSTGSGRATPFASRAQQTEAINDPRYTKDPAYRREVEARVAASNF